MSGKWKLPEIEYSKNISMFRKFTNVVAGTGTVFALLHVFFGYMSFDKTPNQSTGDVPSFFDEAEYRYYLVLALLFLLSIVVSAVFRRIPALALLPATATTTFLLLLFDAELLPKGPMTFILFSLFVFAGNAVISMYAEGEGARAAFRYVISFIGLFAAGWAAAIYFRAPGAAEQIFGTVKPLEELDGIAAVQQYERLEALASLDASGDVIHYLGIAIALILSIAATLFLTWNKGMARVCSLVLMGYLCVAFSFSHLAYFPMFLVVPAFAYCIGCQIYCSAREAVPPSAAVAAAAAEEQKDVTEGDDGEAVDSEATEAPAASEETV